MTERPHGTRSRYQAEGCTCTPCRAAEANYRRQLRHLHRQGKTPFGALVSALEARQRVRRLRIEGFTEAELARRLGLQDRRVTRETHVVTFRKVLQLRWFCRQVLEEPLSHAS